MKNAAREDPRRRQFFDYACTLTEDRDAVKEYFPNYILYKAGAICDKKVKELPP